MNDLSTIKRPKPSDGEEELFRMQEEFFQSRESPSAKVINLRSQSQKPPAPQLSSEKPVSKFRSKFAERRSQAKLSTSNSTGSVVNTTVVNKQENHDDAVQNLPSNPSSIILGRIVEKKFDSSQRLQLPRVDADSGFPGVFKLSEETVGDSSVSLFRRKLNKTTVAGGISMDSKKGGESSSSLLVEGPLGSEIHKENLEKLNQMSEKEILEQKAQLESILSPDLIKFIKSRKNTIIQSKNSTLSGNDSMDVDALESDVPASTSTSNMSLSKNSTENPPEQVLTSADQEMNTENDPFPPASQVIEKSLKSNWMHMDEVEEPKLEWTKDVPTSNVAPDEPYNARFDFEGVLLPFNDENIPTDKGLHHHGEEPGRPGYSLQELLQLSRSSTQQQRCTALTTLANIMEKSRNGWYDKALEPAPLSALNSRNILLLLRFSLDDSSLAVVTASLQAMRAFLYSEADEVCLDRLCGWNYEDGACKIPELLPPKNDVSDTSTLKDHELAQLDSVSAAMRSDLIIRLRYILSEMQPTPIGVTAALEILIRLARHSKTTALNIACTPNLLEVIVRNFLPISTYKLLDPVQLKNAYGVPNVTAVRLCRILTEYAGKPVANRLQNLQIINSLLSYVTSEPGEAGLRLSIEALRLWNILLTNNVAKDSVGGARLMLGSQLQLLLSNHDISSSELANEHASALITLCCHEESLKPTVQVLLTKWSTQLEKLSSCSWGSAKLVAVTLNQIGVTTLRTKWLEMGKVFEGIVLRSNLLSGLEPAADRDPSSLPNLGVLTQNGELQPIVALNSTFLLISTVVGILNKNSMINELNSIFNNQDVARYLQRLSKREWSLETSWYTRPELFFLTNLIRASSKIVLNELASTVVLKIAIKLVSSLPADAPTATKDVLRTILSNERINMATVSEKLNSLQLDGENLIQLSDNISGIYEEFISLGVWSQAALPKDWPYLPLVSLYTAAKSEATWKESDTEKIDALLSLEVVMSELVENLSPTLTFSRLILIYLCETVFLNKNVSFLLKRVFKNFLNKYYKVLDFNKELPGVTSFTDLFTALCENFCANSYGDDGFAAVLLIPVAQRHDKHYRKLLWSEHAGALRYLRLKPEELAVPMAEFLEPVEDDLSLIEDYLTALVRGTVREEWSPVMYKIALHHSAMFLKGDGKLAAQMRTRIGGIPNKELVVKLLQYQCPRDTLLN